jgi:hypothetical protein
LSGCVCRLITRPEESTLRDVSACDLETSSLGAVWLPNHEKNISFMDIIFWLLNIAPIKM